MWSGVAGLLAIGLVVLLWANSRRGSDVTFRGRSLRLQVIEAGPEVLEKASLELGTEKTVPLMIDLLSESDSTLKEWRMKLWLKFSPAFRAKHRSWTPVMVLPTQIKVAMAITHIGTEASNTVPALVRLVKKTPFPSSSAFITALSEAGRESAEARRALLELTQTSNPQLTSMVAMELGRFHRGADEIVPALIESMRAQRTMPYNELLALRMLGTKAAPALPEVVRWLADSNGAGNAAAAMTGIGAQSAPALPLLITRAASNQVWAIDCLRQIGPAAFEALPTLRNVAETNRGLVRLMAIAAIGRITGEQAWAAERLAERIDYRPAPGRHETWSPPWNDMRTISIGLGPQETTCWMLGEIGPPARSTVPVLTNVLARTNGWAPIFAARALSMIDSNTTLAVPRLVRVLGDSNDLNVQLAVRVLGEMGPRASAAVPDLERVARRSWRVRREVLAALKKIRPVDAAREPRQRLQP